MICRGFSRPVHLEQRDYINATRTTSRYDISRKCLSWTYNILSSNHHRFFWYGLHLKGVRTSILHDYGGIVIVNHLGNQRGEGRGDKNGAVVVQSIGNVYIHLTLHVMS